jgi:hypothetical protein
MTAVASRWRVRVLAAFVAAVSGSACASRGAVFVPPVAAGEPAPDAAAVATSAQAACASLRSMTAQAALRGRIGGQRVRGRLDLGVTSEGGARLEAVAPFGLLFVLAGQADRATLLLTREGRVVRDQPAAEIVEALAGVRVSPQTLLSLAAGCPGAGATLADGRRFPDGLLQASGGDRTVWLRNGPSGPRVVAARVGDLIVEYAEAFTGTEPRTLRLRKPNTDPKAAVDLELALSQIEVNSPLDAAAFSIAIPPDAQPITLDELRRSGLLGGR